MIHRPHVDWFALAPVNALLLATAVALLCAVLVPRARRQEIAATFCALGYAAAFGFAVTLYVRSAHGQGVVADAIRRDRLAELATMIVAGSGLLATAISYRERARNDHVGEYYSLLAAAGAGMAFFVAANNLMTLFLALEWFSICLYILCAIDRDRLGGLEAALKYLVVGGFGSAVLLFGSALVYGSSGRLNFAGIAAAGAQHDALLVFGLAMIVAGFGFKASAAPFHMWTPDVYEGAPTPVTAFMTVGPKAAGFAALVRLLVEAFPSLEPNWTALLWFSSVLSMTLGNVVAVLQTNVKRMLAYSAIAHAGYILVGIVAHNRSGFEAVLFYLVIYTVMNLGAFCIVLSLSRKGDLQVNLENYAGLGRRAPLAAAALSLFLVSLAGIPLTGGFIGKFYLFGAAVQQGYIGLAIIGVLNSVLSVFYYFRLIVLMYMREPYEGRPDPEPISLAVLAITVLGAIAVLWMGIFPAIFLNLASNSTLALK